MISDKPIPYGFNFHYPDIQSAIDDENFGTTLIVPPGTYNEITVTRPVNIIAKNSTMPTIYSAANHAINITSINFVNITGFTIQNCGDDWYIAGIDIRSNNNTITDNNICFNNFDGLYLENSNNNTITCNNISSNDCRGIILSDSSNNIIEDNTFMYHYHGIVLAGSKNNTIKERTN